MQYSTAFSISSTANVNQTTGATGFLGGNVLSTNEYNGYVNPALMFELSEAATSVTVEVRDANNVLVRTLNLGATAAGTCSQAWDGRNDAGVLLAAGAYSFTVTGVRNDNSTFAGVTSMNGTLDDVAGLLNIEAGQGKNHLMVSDAGARVADTGVILTNNQIRGLAQVDILHTGKYCVFIVVTWSLVTCACSRAR